MARVNPTNIENTIFENILRLSIQFAKDLQFATIVIYFVNLLKTTYSSSSKRQRDAMSDKVFEHFIRDSTIRSAAGRFIEKSPLYVEARVTFLTGSRLEDEFLNIFGKRPPRDQGQRADMRAIREQILAKKAKLESHSVRDNLLVKTNRIKNINKLKKIALDTGIIDLVQVFPDRTKIDPIEVIDAIRQAAAQDNVFAVDIRGYIKLMQPLDIWVQFLDAISYTRIFVAGFGEDKGVLTAEHLQILRDRIASGELSLRRWYLEVTPRPRRALLLSLNLVGPPPLKQSAVKQTAAKKPPPPRRRGRPSSSPVAAAATTADPLKKFTVFTYAKREDKILLDSILDVETIKQQPRLAWLYAPEKLWSDDIVKKAALQNTVTTYQTAQEFIIKKNSL